MDVFPKQNENNEVAAAYDYAELAKYADKIIIMTYDNHGAWSGSGPIADIRWVEESLKYALKFIPKSKLYLGIAAYGYDWAGEKVESVEHKQISALIQQYKPAVRWYEPSKSPYFTYKGTDGLNHQVWFENARSISYKLDLANKYDIAGVAMWRLGGEDVGYWRTIRDKFR
ncbi:MAG: glycosyl hydrolase family 18 protein [Negativicutes bacterium]|nr:glycosyl hydrolase family 18 protein [Negativicutes bacterium]